jgi:hypothetical protein
VQRLVAHQDPQAGDLGLPAAEVEQTGQLGDEGVLGQRAVLLDAQRPRLGRQRLDRIQLNLGA